MRRTKEEKEFNTKLLNEMFSRFKFNEREAIVSELQLKDGNYKGSMPYTMPTGYEGILIKQLPKKRGYRWNTYSIFKF